MCGICGMVSGSFSQQEENVFLRLLLLNAFRGMDSTGMFAIYDNGKKLGASLLKRTVSPIKFIADHEKDIVNRIFSRDAKALVGHARWATRGKVTRENAHPFDFPNVLGVHNGTLSTELKVNKDKYENDSQQFYAFLNQNDIQTALKEINGYNDAYVFVYFDKRNKTLNIVRNDKRPLWITTISNGATALWTSERETLDYVLRRERIAYADPFQLKENFLLTFDMEADNPAKKYTIEDLKIPRRYATYSYHSDPDRHWQQWSEGKYWSHARNCFVTKEEREKEDEERKAKLAARFAQREEDEKKAPLLLAHESSEENKSVTKENSNGKGGESPPEKVRTFRKRLVPKVPIRGRLNGESFIIVHNHGYTKQEYQDILNNGCSYCTEQSGINEKVLWLTKQEYLCVTCNTNPDIVHFTKSVVGG